MRFAVVGLPRSGTTWAANWLTSDGVLCLHDPMADYAPGELMEKDFGRPWGVSCSGLWVFDGLLASISKRVPVVVLERDPDESNAELQRIGLPALPPWMHERFKWAPGVRVPFGALWDESGARMIWSLVRPDAPFDVVRWRMLRDIQVQPIVDRMRVCDGTVRALRAEYQQQGGCDGKAENAATS